MFAASFSFHKERKNEKWITGSILNNAYDIQSSSRGPLGSKPTSSTVNTNAELAGITSPNPREPGIDIINTVFRPETVNTNRMPYLPG